MSTWTAAKIKALKAKEKIVCLTAHDYTTAQILDRAGIHLILVGDSLAMTALGYKNTLEVTLWQMLHHTAAVARGVREALVVADMPFLSYQTSMAEAIRNAGLFLQKGGAAAVKIEGGAIRAPVVRSLVENGIPVLGHIGLTPQSIHRFGGYHVQGRTAQEQQGLLDDARQLEEAGVFALVLECMPAELAARITTALSVPTIGIGAGPHCDGQILVTEDMLGLYEELAPKFVKHYAALAQTIQQAVESYKREVQQGTFPSEAHSY